MATIIAQNEQELLYELVRHTYDITCTTFWKSDFSKVGKVNIYNNQLQSDRNVSFDGHIYTRKNGVIKGLNLLQQLMFLRSFSERVGIPLRHLTLRENFDAAYSPDGQKYKENVLIHSWVYTGEMIRKLPDGYAIHRVNDVDIVTVTPPISEDHIAVEGETQPATLGQIRQYKAGPVLQTEIPTTVGYFTDFKDVIPVDNELQADRGKILSERENPHTGRRIWWWRNRRRGHWRGLYFVDHLSAVRCDWNSLEQSLHAAATGPLVREYLHLDGGAMLGIGTNTPLNK